MLGVVEGAAWYTALTTFIAYRLFSASKYSLKTEKEKTGKKISKIFFVADI